jgi:hypothetical protein
MANSSANADIETRQQEFERILSREPFKGLKAILDSVCRDRAALCEAIDATKSYEELLAKVGFQVVLTKQIHVQDSYSHVGVAGGIKAVLSYHDIPTHSSFPTLVNFDSTVTTTAKAAGFFNEMLASFRRQLSA